MQSLKELNLNSTAVPKTFNHSPLAGKGHLKRKLAALEDLKKSLLHQAFNGEL